MAAALAVLAMVAVAACQQPQEPESSTGAEPSSEVTTEATTEPVTEPSSEPTMETPTIEPPEVPAIIGEDSTQGAGSAAWYFLSLWNYMRATGDTAAFEAMTAESCTWCTDQVANLNEIFDLGATITGDGLIFDMGQATVEYPTAEQPAYVVRLNAVLEPFEVIGADGAVAPVEGASYEPIAIALLHSDGGFVVTGVNYAES